MSILYKPGRTGDQVERPDRLDIDWEELERRARGHRELGSRELGSRELVCHWVPDDHGPGLKSVWVTVEAQSGLE